MHRGRVAVACQTRGGLLPNRPEQHVTCTLKLPLLQSMSGLYRGGRVGLLDKLLPDDVTGMRVGDGLRRPPAPSATSCLA